MIEADDGLGELVRTVATNDSDTVLIERLTVRDFARSCAIDDPAFLRHITALPKDNTCSVAFSKMLCVEMSAENAYALVKDIDPDQQPGAAASVH